MRDNVTIVVIPVPIILPQASRHISIQVTAVWGKAPIPLRHWSNLQEWHSDWIYSWSDWLRLVD